MCGEQTLMNWKMVFDLAELMLGFKEQENIFMLLKGSHILANQVLAGKWRDEEAILVVEKEKDAKSFRAVK